MRTRLWGAPAVAALALGGVSQAAVDPAEAASRWDVLNPPQYVQRPDVEQTWRFGWDVQQESAEAASWPENPGVWGRRMTVVVTRHGNGQFTLSATTFDAWCDADGCDALNSATVAEYAPSGNPAIDLLADGSLHVHGTIPARRIAVVKGQMRGWLDVTVSPGCPDLPSVIGLPAHDFVHRLQTPTVDFFEYTTPTTTCPATVTGRIGAIRIARVSQSARLQYHAYRGHDALDLGQSLDRRADVVGWLFAHGLQRSLDNDRYGRWTSSAGAPVTSTGFQLPGDTWAGHYRIESPPPTGTSPLVYQPNVVFSEFTAEDCGGAPPPAPCSAIAKFVVLQSTHGPFTLDDTGRLSGSWTMKLWEDDPDLGFVYHGDLTMRLSGVVRGRGEPTVETWGSGSPESRTQTVGMAAVDTYPTMHLGPARFITDQPQPIPPAQPRENRFFLYRVFTSP